MDNQYTNHKHERDRDCDCDLKHHEFNNHLGIATTSYNAITLSHLATLF